MNADALLRIVLNLKALADGAGDRRAAAQLATVARHLYPMGNELVNRTSTNGLRSSIEHEELEMKFADALRYLRIFRKAADEVGRKADLKAIDLTLTALEGEPDKRVDTRQPKSTPAPRETEAGRKYLSKLTSAADDRTSAARLLDQLVDDESMGVAELNWLTWQYAGTATRYSSRAQAIKRLRSRFETVTQRRGKSRAIKRLTEAQN